ncbi:MAG: hypothetical protein M1511_08315 [Deltaproteobacteria bacterium]|nr:hypothetical protein [Deltaproteobacteria bacterium]
MKILLRAFFEILASLALLVLGTLLAVFFIVIFLIWGWPLTILLLFVAIQKIYFSSHDRRRASLILRPGRRLVPTQGLMSKPLRNFPDESVKGKLSEIHEDIPTLLN